MRWLREEIEVPRGLLVLFIVGIVLDAVNDGNWVFLGVLAVVSAIAFFWGWSRDGSPSST